MHKLPRSSSDLSANRRADFAEMEFAGGAFAAAAELMIGALELDPAWVLGWFRLGEFHHAAGNSDAAAQAWRVYLGLDPQDHAGATLQLALIGAAPMPQAPPNAFVEALFDEYAPRFDVSLVEKLEYRAPDHLLTAIRAARQERFATAIDHGCGTGLMGQRLRFYCDRLEGYDISERMLAKARAKAIYDHLERADIAQMKRDGTPADLVAAADVYMYLGALDAPFASAARLLAQGGLFAFTVEALEDAPGLALRDTRRFAHSEAYVREKLDGAGFDLISLDRATIRQDRNAPVEGLVVTAACR
ncbi:MAG: methyltransferase domain-containing protein [Mesorhizobium sp.]